MFQEMREGLSEGWKNHSAEVVFSALTTTTAEYIQDVGLKYILPGTGSLIVDNDRFCQTLPIPVAWENGEPTVSLAFRFKPGVWAVGGIIFTYHPTESMPKVHQFDLIDDEVGSMVISNNYLI